MEKIERRGGRYRLEICPEKTKGTMVGTLIPQTPKNVKADTIIVTDLWKQYFVFDH